MSDYNVLDFGAIGDGIANDTLALQKTIDACTSNGGGRVLVPGGYTFRCGTFALKSNVELHLEYGATIAASSDWHDYQYKMRVGALTSGDVKENSGASSTLIFAQRAHNIAITGGGVIDGGGRFFVEQDLGYIYKMREARPFTLFLIGCSRLTIRDVIIRDGALWTVRLTGCEDVVIQAISIQNDLKLPNNDSIDLDRCRNVRISDCNIVSGDDAICIKACPETEEYGACENITVRGCTVVSTSTALTVGCECTTPMRNIIFDSCVVQASHRGLGIHLSQESDVENVIFSNIIVETRLFHTAWWGRGEPIYIVAIPWTEKIGHIRHVRFSNILCRSENGAHIEGWQQGLIEDLVFDNVQLELDKWSKWPGGQQDLRPYLSNEVGLREHPTSAFFIQNAADITLRNCTVKWGKERPDYFRHALESHNVENLITENFKGEAAHPEKYAAVLSD